MIENKSFIECKQDNIDICLFSLNTLEFINNSYIDYYNEKEEDGYQRPLYRPHYRKIADYLIDNENGLLPTAIIAAIERTSIEFNKNGITIKDEFRVVDGQHRREALLYIKEIEPEEFERRIKNLNFPIVLMIIDKKNRREYTNEIQSFIDINKKGRKVSTDLAYTLLKKITEKKLEDEVDISEHDIQIHIATSVANKLNHNKKSCWYKEIKTGGDEDYGKAISQNAFIKSLLPFISLYCTKIYGSTKLSTEVEEYIDEIEEIIINLWNIIGNKWEDCFFWDEENDSFRYDRYYNIQKGVGTFPLHWILADYYKEDEKEYLSEFENCLSCSDINDEMWRVGGEFSMYNSQSGFKQIKEKIDVWV